MRFIKFADDTKKRLTCPDCGWRKPEQKKSTQAAIAQMSLYAGDSVRILKCPQDPKLVGKVGEFVKFASPQNAMIQVRFVDGYQRIIRRIWTEAVNV